MSSLLNISPLDGRYANATKPLQEYFSEYALIKYRVKVEVEYLIALSEVQHPAFEVLRSIDFEALRSIYQDFTVEDATDVKDIEKTTNHDVKAVEYFLRGKLTAMQISPKALEIIHFGLTSQDINNTAIPLSIKDFLHEQYYALLDSFCTLLDNSSKEWRHIPMLAYTHGQPASPTTVGKELLVFGERLRKSVVQLKGIPISGKFGGATGNMNAHYIAAPNVDWHQFASHFLTKSLGIDRNYPTTQIDHYDNLAELFDCLRRINTILVDLCRDVWQYVSMGYFTQKLQKQEVGSSAMPHKVNPIDFENAEGNMLLANAIFDFLSNKLPISRLQRDLTDSTVLRNIGVPLGHNVVALRSLVKGWGKLQLHEQALHADLEAHWEVVAEAIQSYLRLLGVEDPYGKLKDFSRGKKMQQKDFQLFIETLGISAADKEHLLSITPHNYTGKVPSV